MRVLYVGTKNFSLTEEQVSRILHIGIALYNCLNLHNFFCKVAVKCDT